MTALASRRRLIGLGALLAAAALTTIVVLTARPLDPDRQARELALRDARAAAELDFARLWRDYSPCYQRRNPRAAWIALKEGEAHALGGVRAPDDTRYLVVAVRAQGAYRRVEVRVRPPGRRQLDYEVVVRTYGGRWVTVDTGEPGHSIADDCAPGRDR